MNVFRLCIPAALAASLAFTGCGGGGQEAPASDVGQPVKGELVLVHDLSDPEGINPLVVNDASARNIFDRIFQKLLDQDLVTTELVPILVEARPTISEDHLTYTFKLKQGIKFSDGTPMTTKDVIFSFKAVKNPLVVEAAPLRNYYEDMKDIVAQDDYSFTVTMLRPYFMAEYQLGGMWILPKHKLDPKNLTDKYTIAETNSMASAQANPAMKEFAVWYNSADVKKSFELNIGSGPYLFDEWKTNEYLSIKRNPNYWNAANDKDNPSYLDRVKYVVIPDRNAAVIALKNQDIDFMEYVPPTKFEEELDTNNLKHLVKRPFGGEIYSYIGWNTKRPALADKEVRRALSHLVDRQQLIKIVMRGLAEPINSPIYQQAKEYDRSIPSINYDLNKAKELLDASGWKDSDGDGIRDKVVNGTKTKLSFKFLLNAGNETREQIAIFIADECKKVGINAELQRLEWSVFLQNLRSHQFDAYIGSWVNDPIPSDPYQIWHSSQATNSGSNYVGFQNPRADQLMEMTRLEFDENKRIEYMKEFQRIVVDEQPYTFLWSPSYPAAYNKRLQNVSFSLVRPGYQVTQWWVPKGQWKYSAGK